MKISVLGIDLAKNVFQLHGNSARGKKVLGRQLRSQQLLRFLQSLEEKCVVAMEACSQAHYWGRKIRELGFEVRLIPPQYVRPFVKGNKDDSADAEAICEAAVRPNMHFVPIKTVEQIDLMAIHNVRSRLVKQRTALTNSVRGYLAEHGVTVAKGTEELERFIRSVLEESSIEGVTQMCRELLAGMYSELLDINKRIEVLEERLEQFAKQDEQCKRIQKVKGVGLITATAMIAAIGNPKVFKNGRHFAAWLGLVPKHTGTGGKIRQLGMSKRGDNYLRYLLIHGGRAVVGQAARQQENPLSKWAKKLKDKNGTNKATVAVANKNARVIWHLLAHEVDYDVKKCSKAA